MKLFFSYYLLPYTSTCLISGLAVPDIFCAGRMRPIFCGNFEFETRQSELERLFKRYGKVDRVDMKSGKIVTHVNFLSVPLFLSNLILLFLFFFKYDGPYVVAITCYGH